MSPVTFHFGFSRSVNVALHFQDIEGNYLPSSAGGARNLQGQIPMSSFSGPVEPTPEQLARAAWIPDVTSIAVPGAAFREFYLGAGAASLTITPGAYVAPSNAVTYTISVSGAQRRAQT